MLLLSFLVFSVLLQPLIRFNMCYSPLIIKNNSLDFSPTCDRLFLTVPCGHCGECLARKQNDYYVRAYFEYLHCKKHNGFTLFTTLTYNPESLPLLVNRNNGECVPAFNKRDVQNFLQALKKRINRYSKHDSFRYIITSEYGSKHFRPHYHSLIHIYSDIPVTLVQTWIRELWKYGLVDFGKNGIVNSAGAIKYTCKYITKDINYLDDYKSFYEETFYRYGKDVKSSIINNCLPFHLQSKSYGQKLLIYTDFQQLLNGTVYIPEIKGLKPYQVPLYIDRQLFYDYKNDSYKLNANGVAMKMVRTKEYSLYLRNYINNIINTIPQWYNDTAQFDFYHRTGRNINKELLTEIVGSYKKEYDYDTVIDYIQNRRNYSTLDDTSIFPEQTRIKPFSYYERLTRSVDNQFNPYHYGTNDPETFKLLSSHTYNELEHGLDDFVQLIDNLRYCYARFRNNEYFLKYQKQQRLKKYRDIYGM